MAKEWYVLRKDDNIIVEYTNPNGLTPLLNDDWKMGHQPFPTREQADDYVKKWREYDKAHRDAAKQKPILPKGDENSSI
jgi:hypothetical protein